MGKARCERNRAWCGPRHLSELARVKNLIILNFRPRLTEVEDISKAKRNMKMTHVALDVV